MEGEKGRERAMRGRKGERQSEILRGRKGEREREMEEEKRRERVIDGGGEGSDRGSERSRERKGGRGFWGAEGCRLSESV